MVTLTENKKRACSSSGKAQTSAANKNTSGRRSKGLAELAPPKKAKEEPLILKEPLGDIIDVSIPLSPKSYEQLYSYAMYPRQIPAAGDEERGRIKDRAREILKAHDEARDRDPKASCGLDLNNFWKLYESVPGWLKEGLSPQQKWGPETREGFSAKYLDSPLSKFAQDIDSAIKACRIDPVALEDRIQKATSAGRYRDPAHQELRKLYIYLRDLGYADRELTQ